MRQEHLHVAREATARADLLEVRLSALGADLANEKRRRTAAETQLAMLSEKDGAIYDRACRAEEAENKLTLKLEASKRLVEELKLQLRSERAGECFSTPPPKS